MPNPPDPNLDVEIEVEKCPNCDTELEQDESGAAYCPSETCPRFMIDVGEDALSEDELNTGTFDDDEEEDED